MPRQNKPQTRPTLRDVAAVASVDPSVVSRVINRDPNLSITEKTRARVESAIRELNYRPNVSARALRLDRTMTIGYLFPSFPNPISEPLIRGVQSRALARGYTVVVGLTGGEDGIPDAFQKLLGEGRVDGLLVNIGATSQSQIRELAKSDPSLVLVNGSIEGVRASVILDDERIASVATEHLVKLGHTTLAHIGGPDATDTAMRRFTGFESTASGKAQIDVEYAADWDYEAGLRATERLLERHPMATGIVVANLPLAVGAMTALQHAGLNVPKDVSVVALHDAPLAEFSNPPITAVSTPLYELGVAAVDTLIDMIESGTVRELHVVTEPEPTLIKRSSTASPELARDR